MGISIYYTAHREQPLTAEERSAIDRLIADYSIEDQLTEYFQTGKGHNWQSFYEYEPGDPPELGVVFDGATGLPDNSDEAVWVGIQHWCSLLSQIRRALPDAEWRVNVEDHAMVWDESVGAYDPSK